MKDLNSMSKAELVKLAEALQKKNEVAEKRNKLLEEQNKHLSDLVGAIYTYIS